MQHLRGNMYPPNHFQSRNPPLCQSHSCQICQFIDEVSYSVVRSISVEDILSGHKDVPYNNRSAWKGIQLECPDLKRVHAHLSTGTRPTKSKLTIVKRYLQKVIISKDGLLVVIQSQPFLPVKELIVIPQHIVHGLMTSLHLRLNHPSESQLLQVFKRNFFAIKAQSYANLTVQKCETCQSFFLYGFFF